MSRRRRTKFTFGDHERLRRDLLSRPAIVLREFAACQVGSLSDLPAFQQIRRDDPEAAARIEAVARSLGIPIEPELSLS